MTRPSPSATRSGRGWRTRTPRSVRRRRRRRAATTRPAAGNPRAATGPATFAGTTTGDAGNADVAGNAPALPPAARVQLEAIRDEWLRPLIERNEALAERAGRLEAERDAAIAERDALRARLAEAETPPPPADDTGARGRSGWRARVRRLLGGAE